MVKTIDITVFSNGGVSPDSIIDAGVQGDDKTTALNVTVDSEFIPEKSANETLKVYAECVNGAGEYYVSDFLDFTDNTINFPLPIEITRGGGMASLNFVFSVLNASNVQQCVIICRQIKLKFEDSAQFYQSEYLDTMAGALANVYKYRGQIEQAQTDIENLQSQIDALGGADVSGIQSDIENLQSQINRLDSNTLDAVGRLNADDDNLQSQIDNKSDATNLVNGPAEGSLRSICSHSEQSIGDWAVTLGYGTFATGVASYAEGFYNSASGDHSHAEGQYNQADGENSHAEGSDTIANGFCQHVQGRYNIEDKSARYAHIVGNGHDDLLGGRSNAHTLDWNGNAWFAGDVLVGGASQDDANAISLVNISTEHKTDIESLKAKDTDLQSQINTKATRKVAIVGSDTANSAGWYKVASGTMAKWTSLSLLFAVHTPATSGKHSGILQLDLRGGTEAIEIGDTLKLGWLVRAGFDLSQVIVVVDGYDWALYYKVQSYQFFRAFFEVIQESNDVSIDKVVYTLHTDSVVETTAPVATATSTDLGTVNTANKLTTARNINGIAFDGSADINITANDIASTSGQTVYQTIVDLTARIEALESSASS